MYQRARPLTYQILLRRKVKNTDRITMMVHVELNTSFAEAVIVSANATKCVG